MQMAASNFPSRRSLTTLHNERVRGARPPWPPILAPAQGWLYNIKQLGQPNINLDPSQEQPPRLAGVPLHRTLDGLHSHKSTDGGDNWSTILQSPQQKGDAPSGYPLAIDPRVPTFPYPAGMGWVGRSGHGDSTWEDLSTGLPRSLNPTALALDSPILTQTLYLGANGG